jgi:hypothetical protein
MILAASELFSFCFSEHIPEDSDLIFAEFGERLCSIVRVTNHYPTSHQNQPSTIFRKSLINSCLLASHLTCFRSRLTNHRVTNTLTQYERLIRGLLDLPKQPAVLNLE